MQKFEKQMSAQGNYFYIVGLADGDDGWISTEIAPKDGMAALPFRFWKVLKGLKVQATDDDVKRYKAQWGKK